MRLRGIPDYFQLMTPGQACESADVSRLAVEMDRDQCTRSWSNEPLDFRGIQRKILWVDIGKNGPGIHCRHHGCRCNKGKIWNNNFVPWAKQRVAGEIERRGPRRDRDGVAGSNAGCESRFKFFGDSPRPEISALQGLLNGPNFRPADQYLCDSNSANGAYSSSRFMNGTQLLPELYGPLP